MTLFYLLATSPATGDQSPQKNTVVFLILGIALVATVVLGLFAGKGKK